MIKNILAAAALALAFATPAFADQSIQCNPIADVKPADNGWQLVGIRRPKIDATFTTMSLQVYMPADQARTDSGDDAKVVSIDQCPTNVGYKVRTVRDGDWDKTEIPLPTTAKGIKIKSCSAATKTCWTATFDGDFTKWVTMTPATADTAPSAKIVGKYHGDTKITGSYQDDDKKN